MKDKVFIRSGRVAAIMVIIATWIGAAWGIIQFLKMYSQMSSLRNQMGGSGMGIDGRVVMQIIFVLAIAAVVHALMAAALCVINKHSTSTQNEAPNQSVQGTR
jgi:hypothetical protein